MGKREERDKKRKKRKKKREIRNEEKEKKRVKYNNKNKTIYKIIKKLRIKKYVSKQKNIICNRHLNLKIKFSSKLI